MPDGSSSDAPVIKPGPRRRSRRLAVLASSGPSLINDGPMLSRSGCQDRLEAIVAAYLNSAQQHENEQDDDDEAQSATAIVTRPVKRASAEAAESAQKGDDQNDK